jgi:hypothetical protein
VGIIKSPEFQESIPYCDGIYALSKYHADFLSKLLDVRIEVVYHPTEETKRVFEFDRFIKNKNPKLVNVGWWLRKMSSIYQLQVNGYQKCRMYVDSAFWKMEMENENIHLTDEELKSVVELQYLNDETYDELLSENIVFLDLYDSSANNTIIECIARATPVLVNPLPSVVEYLGKDYPFYFVGLAEAQRKLESPTLVRETHEYLKSFNGKTNITKKIFPLTKGRINPPRG